MKKILIGLVVLILLIAGAVFFLLQNMDTLVTEAVNEYGSDILKAEVRLEETKIDIQSGKGTLRGLKVGNPEGFHTDSAMQINEISLTLDKDSLTSDPIIIKDITILAPQATYELGGDGSNVDTLKKNVDDYVAQFSGGKSSDSATKESGSKESGRKLIIENLRVTNGKVGVSATFLKGEQLTVSMPDIHIKDIGKSSNGATPGEAAEKIFGALQSSIKKAIAPLNLGKVGEVVEDVVNKGAKEVEEGVGKVSKEIDKNLKDVSKNVEKEMGKALEGLFGK
jgi:hypothetical protein